MQLTKQKQETQEDPDRQLKILTNQITNSKKQLSNVEHDYIQTLKKIKKYQTNPHIENELNGNIWLLDQQIQKEKQN